MFSRQAVRRVQSLFTSQSRGYEWACGKFPFITRLSQDQRNGEIAVVGFPSDVNSSFERGTSEAPDIIREAFICDSANTFSEDCRDMQQHFHDFGNVRGLEEQTSEEAHNSIVKVTAELLKDGHKILSLGGDHAITYPIMEAYASFYPNLRILHFDAHCDLYENFQDNKYSHASPFARILENKLATKLTSVGIRTTNTHQKEQAKRYGVHVIDMKSVSKLGISDVAHQITSSFRGRQVYISLDMDVLDPAFACGVSHYEPGGMTTRELITLIQSCKGEVVGADLVELNPRKDFQNMTAMTSAKLFKELVCRMAKPPIDR